MAVIVIEQRIKTDSGEVYAKRWSARPEGESGRPCFLLFHDSIGSVELWRDFPQLLVEATGFDVIAYDRLGFGKSDEHPGKLPLTFILDEGRTVAPVICAEFGVEKLIPLGHSVGGEMAIGAAVSLREKALAVIAIAAQSFVEDATLEGVRQAKVEFSDPVKVKKLERYHGVKARWALSAWFDTWLHPEFEERTLDKTLKQLECPVLTLQGGADEYGTVEHAERIARLAAGGARKVIFEDFGHFPHREEPRLVLNEIVRFLRDEGILVGGEGELAGVVSE